VRTPDDLDPLELIGTWALARQIVDRALDEHSTVDGTTVLTLQLDGRVRWAESGVLTRRDSAIPVSRVLFVEQRAGGWFVTFEDGRDFHPWAPSTPVRHDCAPDLYIGTLDRLDDDRWSVVWEVSGPGKDYTMTSILTRVAS